PATHLYRCTIAADPPVPTARFVGAVDQEIQSDSHSFQFVPSNRYSIFVSIVHARTSAPNTDRADRCAAVRTMRRPPSTVVNGAVCVIVADVVAVIPAVTSARASSIAPSGNVGGVGDDAAVPCTTPITNWVAASPSDTSCCCP